MFGVEASSGWQIVCAEHTGAVRRDPQLINNGRALIGSVTGAHMNVKVTRRSACTEQSFECAKRFTKYPQLPPLRQTLV